MKVKVRNVTVQVRMWNEDAEHTIVMLHGFTGSGLTWEKVVSYLPKSIKTVAIDLMGHGLTDSPSEISAYSMEEQIDILHEVMEKLNLAPFTLLGYSMGGRVALSYAVKYQNQVEHLILESASPGLKKEEERLARQQSDKVLANKIIQNGLQNFVDQWENIPLFASQKRLPEEVQLSIRQERLAQTEIGLANSLRGMGTGFQAPLWTKLHEINIPVTLITGSLDQKFCHIALQMKEALPNCSHIQIDEVGHAIHVENPTQFATIVKDVLKN